MIRWPDWLTSSDADSTCQIGRKKSDEYQLQPTAWNTLRRLTLTKTARRPTVGLVCTGLYTTVNTSSNPLSPPLLHSRSVKMMCVRSSGRTKEERHQAQTVWHQPVWKPVLTSWPPSSHRSSTDQWSCAKSLPASNAPPSSPSQRNSR